MATGTATSWTRSGHGWTVASHVEDVTPEEMTRRMAELFG
jgi:hypothetical protein